MSKRRILDASQVQKERGHSTGDGGLKGSSPFVSVATPSLEQQRQWAREDLQQMALLSPWTTYEAHEPSFSEELNRELAQRVHETILDQLAPLLERLERLQTQRADSGLLPLATVEALLESRLVVEAKRKVHPEHVAASLKAAMRATMHSAPSTANSLEPEDRGSPALVDSETESSSPSRARSKAISVILHDDPSLNWRHQLTSTEATSVDSNTFERDSQALRPLLCVQFPTRGTSSALEEAGDNSEEESEAQQATHFRSRPVAASAVADAGAVAERREPQEPRVRYIMSTRLGAVPPTKGILAEYPIPKEVLDALERHRHFHVDESSPLTAFEPLRLPASIANEGEAAALVSAGGEWECFYRRSVPLERSPVSFVLASLAVASEKPLPPPCELFHQQALIAAASDDTLLLHEVRKLYDSTHDVHHAFRDELHRHLDLPYLVDLSFRSALTSASYFVDDDDETDGEQPGGREMEPSVQIPTHLRRQRVQSSGAGEGAGAAAKWRFLQHGVHRMANRRGAISMPMKSEANARGQRNELLIQFCALTPQDVEFLTLWYGFSPDAEAEALAAATNDGEEASGSKLDPVPMAPRWSARFELVWKQLGLSTSERLDLAIKYSSLAQSARLPDAVALWETAGALITEHEDLLRLVRSTLTGLRRHAAASLAEDTAMLQALTASAANVREILVLAYVEVGDFVTYQGNFYLARMEHDAAEIRRLMEEGGASEAAQQQ